MLHGRALSSLTLLWLQENRIPAYLFGIWSIDAAQLPDPAKRPPQLENTNPSDTVRATESTTVGSLGAHMTTAGSASIPLADFASTQVPVPACSGGASFNLALQQQPSTNSRPPLPRTTSVLWMDCIAGIFLDRQAARERMRQELKARDIIAIVTDTKPLTHEKYFLYSATCLRCEQIPRAVTYKGTCYRQSVGVPAKTLVIRQHGVHEHDVNIDQASTYSPLQNAAAKAYLATAGRHTKKGLTNHLQAAGFALSALPEACKISRWLQNHKPKSTKRTLADPPPPRACLVQRSLDRWPKSEPSSCSDIFVLQDPPPEPDTTRVFMAFSCKGMCDVMRRYADADVAMLIDLKPSCMEHG